MTKNLLLTLLIAFSSIACTSAWAAPTDVNFTVTMSEAVNVNTSGGTPRIAVDVDGQTRYATYSAGTGTSSLTFSYAPTIGDLDLNGITLTSPLELNGGTITDLNGNPETDLTFTVPNTSGIKIDYPSLSMDFTNGANGRYTLNGTAYTSLPSFLTATGGSFTRASTATYFDSTGTLQTVSNNTPRLDYDPITHTAKGMLIEESRTNELFYSDDPVNWSINGATVASTGLTELGIFKSVHVRSNGQTFHRINAIRTGGVYRPFTADIAATFYYRSGSSGRARIILYDTIIPQTSDLVGNVGSLNVSQTGAGTISNIVQSQIPSVNGTIYVVKFKFSPINNTDTIAIGIGPSSVTVGEDVIFLGGQVEYGQFPTSFIPTTTSAVTRQQDRLTIPVGGWFSAPSGTLYAQVEVPFLGGPVWPGLASLDAGSGESIALGIRDNSTDDPFSEIYNSSVQTFSAYKGIAYVPGTAVQSAIAYEQNNTIACYDGLLGALNTSTAIPTVSTLRVGAYRGGGSGLNGWAKQVKYYPQRSSGTQLQLLTQ